MVKVRLNQDKNFVEEFKKTLSDNDGYCPCRIEKTEDTKVEVAEVKEEKTEEKAEAKKEEAKEKKATKNTAKNTTKNK